MRYATDQEYEIIEGLKRRFECFITDLYEIRIGLKELKKINADFDKIFGDFTLLKLKSKLLFLLLQLLYILEFFFCFFYKN